MGRGRRRRIATGIYEDDFGIAAVLHRHGHREELRFPPKTPLYVIQRRLDGRRQQLALTAPAPPERGTVADLVADAVKLRPATAALLRPWARALGDRQWWTVQRADLQAVTDKWRAAGLSASRCNKRISALRVAWKAIAPDAVLTHGIEKVARYSEPPAVTRGVPLSLVTFVLSFVPESKSRARLEVLAWTGQPPARVMAISPSHVRWQADPPELYVSPRRKGKGSSDAWLPLLPEAVAALRSFFKLKATGPFQTAALGRTLKRAIAKARRRLIAEERHEDAARLIGFRLYDLRHSFLSELGTVAADIYAVAEYAGHANLQTTRRYMRAAASPRMKQGIAALSVPRASATYLPETGAKVGPGRPKASRRVRRKS